VTLVQEAGVNDETAKEYEEQFPKVSIACNESARRRGGVAIIINNQTTSWSPIEQGEQEDWEQFRDDEGRLLIRRIKSRGREITIGSI